MDSLEESVNELAVNSKKQLDAKNHQGSSHQGKRADSTGNFYQRAFSFRSGSSLYSPSASTSLPSVLLSEGMSSDNTEFTYASIQQIPDVQAESITYAFIPYTTRLLCLFLLTPASS